MDRAQIFKRIEAITEAIGDLNYGLARREGTRSRDHRPPAGRKPETARYGRATSPAVEEASPMNFSSAGDAGRRARGGEAVPVAFHRARLPRDPHTRRVGSLRLIGEIGEDVREEPAACGVTR